MRFSYVFYVILSGPETVCGYLLRGPVLTAASQGVWVWLDVFLVAELVALSGLCCC